MPYIHLQYKPPEYYLKESQFGPNKTIGSYEILMIDQVPDPKRTERVPIYDTHITHSAFSSNQTYRVLEEKCKFLFDLLNPVIKELQQKGYGASVSINNAIITLYIHAPDTKYVADDVYRIITSRKPISYDAAEAEKIIQKGLDLYYNRTETPVVKDDAKSDKKKPPVSKGGIFAAAAKPTAAPAEPVKSTTTPTQ